MKDRIHITPFEFLYHDRTTNEFEFLPLMTRDWEAQPFDVDLVEPRLGGAQSAEQPAAGPELRDELREGRPLGGLEAPAEPDQRPESVLERKYVDEVKDHKMVFLSLF